MKKVAPPKFAWQPSPTSIFALDRNTLSRQFLFAAKKLFVKTRATILLVEDNEDDVFLIRRAFKAAGITNPLHVAQDGQEALDYLSRAEKEGHETNSDLPTVVFLDLKLPILMGRDVLAWIRNQPFLRGIDVVVLTSSDEPSDLNDAYRLGALSYLVKPPTVDQLMDLARAFKWSWLQFDSPDRSARLAAIPPEDENPISYLAGCHNDPALIDTLAQINRGDHVALIYRTRREQLACSIPFIKLGLDANERCLYIADSNSVLVIRHALAEAGVDVDAAERTNSLLILTKKETYLRHGLFEPSKVVADLEQWISESLKMGFTGFRAAGEMTWALDLPSSFAGLLDYARQLESVAGQFVALCQFDETRFPKEVIDGVLQVHGKVIKDRTLIKNGGTHTAPREKEF